MSEESKTPENALKAFGLTEYEAKAYITLLKYGNLTAEKLSELGAIPLPRVYDTITELHKKGFVLISKTRPKMFKPISIEKSLNSLIEIQKKKFDKRLDTLQRDVKTITKDLSAIKQQPEIAPLYKWNIWSIEKREHITKMLKEQEGKAEKEIIIFAGDFSWAEDAIDDLKKAMNKGVKVKAVMHAIDSPKVKEIYNLVKKMGIDVRTGYTGLLRGQIIDKKVAYIATKFSGKGINLLEGGEKGSETENKYELIIFDNLVLVETLLEYFKFVWESLKK